MRSLKVNETKSTLRNIFILDLFALEGEKESKYNERIPFWDFVKKTLAFKRRIYASFRTISVLGIFWRLPLLFLDTKIKFIEFTSSRPFFEIVCYFI